MEENYLNHHGVIGMRWGVRRSKKQLEKRRGSPNDKEDVHEDYKKAHSKTSVKSMSDKELRERINRLQMEKQYSQLTQKDKSAGSKFVSDVLRESGKNIASKYVTKMLGGAIDKGLGSVASKNPSAKATMDMLNILKN